MKSFKTLFLVCIAICFSFAAITDARETTRNKIDPAKKSTAYKIIHLCSYGDICVCPSGITVKSGTTVIWINQSEMPIKIHFEGKPVTAAGENHIHFRVDNEGSYISNMIPNGARATLKFVEKGRYDYVAETIPGASTDPLRQPREYNGTIIVK